MKARIPKNEYVDSQSFFTITLLAICRVLHEEEGFGPVKLNRLIDKLSKFFAREDLTTIGEELIYWADKYGIDYKK